VGGAELDGAQHVVVVVEGAQQRGAQVRRQVRLRPEHEVAHVGPVGAQQVDVVDDAVERVADLVANHVDEPLLLAAVRLSLGGALVLHACRLLERGQALALELLEVRDVGEGADHGAHVRAGLERRGCAAACRGGGGGPGRRVRPGSGGRFRLVGGHVVVVAAVRVVVRELLQTLAEHPHDAAVRPHQAELALERRAGHGAQALPLLVDLGLVVGVDVVAPAVGLLAERREPRDLEPVVVGAGDMALWAISDVRRLAQAGRGGGEHVRADWDAPRRRGMARGHTRVSLRKMPVAQKCASAAFSSAQRRRDGRPLPSCWALHAPRLALATAPSVR